MGEGWARGGRGVGEGGLWVYGSHEVKLKIKKQIAIIAGEMLFGFQFF